MNTLQKKMLLAALGLGALVAAAPASAYVMAESSIELLNFQILGSDGQILDATGANGATPTGDFATLTFTGTADMKVSLDSGGTQSNSANNPPTNPINFAPICVGSGCNPLLPDDSFPHLAAPPSGEYAAADQYESGAPIANFGFTSPATVGNMSAAALETSSDGASSDSNNNLNSSFIFTLNQDTGITFDFDIDAFLQVAMTGDEVFPATATSSYQLSFSIVNQQTQQTVFVWNIDVFGNGLNTISLNAPLFSGLDTEIALNEAQTHFSRATGTLTAGTPYQLSARINTNADVFRQAVPEPATLGLLGIGLVALGASTIRRRKIDRV